MDLGWRQGGPPGWKHSIRLLVGGRYSSEYWMHLEVPAAAKLAALDQYLRDTWLECCGHLSAFEINGRRYYSSNALDLEGETMSLGIGKVLALGVKAVQECDVGAPTELTLADAAEQNGITDGKSVRVIARNDPPPIPCQSSGRLATIVCTACIFEGEGWLCDECAREHGCDEEMRLPVVNSPRVGVCGYTGGRW